MGDWEGRGRGGEGKDRCVGWADFTLGLGSWVSVSVLIVLGGVLVIWCI